MPKHKDIFETWNSSSSTMCTRQSTKDETEELQIATAVKGKNKTVSQKNLTAAAIDKALHSGNENIGTQNKAESTMRKRNGPTTKKPHPKVNVGRPKGLKHMPLLLGCSTGNEQGRELNNSFYKEYSNVEVSHTIGIVQEEEEGSPHVLQRASSHFKNATAIRGTNTTFSTLQSVVLVH
jgi:hypothetical protein